MDLHSLHKRRITFKIMHRTLADLIKKFIKWNAENQNLKNLRK